MKIPAFLFTILYINYALAKVREPGGFPDMRDIFATLIISCDICHIKKQDIFL